MNITEKSIKVADKILEILVSEECSVMEAQDILYWIIKDIKSSSTVQIKETCKERFSEVLKTCQENNKSPASGGEQKKAEDDNKSNPELPEGNVFTNAQRCSLGLKCRSEDERLIYSILHILGDNGLSVDRASRVLSDAQTMLPTLAKLPMLATGKARI